MTSPSPCGGSGTQRQQPDSEGTWGAICKWFKDNQSQVFVFIGGLALYILFGLGLGLFLHYFYIEPMAINDASKAATAKKDLIQALALILAGVAGAIGIYFTWRGQWITREGLKDTQENAREQLQLTREGLKNAHKNTQKQLRLSREGQITDRFTRAIDQLGVDSPQVRIGGIYALAAISSESDPHYWPVIEILSAYIRERSHWLPKGDYVCGEDSEPEEALSHHHRLPDIQAILYILKERKRFYDQGEDKYIWLTNTNLQHADLRGIHLERARLRGANLKGARLESAHLRKARLRNTIFEEANLEKARLQRADLEKAILCKADLEGADLRNANLQGAKALTQKQIDAACGNGETTLPEARQRPAVWRKPIEEQREIQQARLQNE